VSEILTLPAFAFATASPALPFWPANRGIAIAARIPDDDDHDQELDQGEARIVGESVSEFHGVLHRRGRQLT
jgi:hypothetical protein